MRRAAHDLCWIGKCAGCGKTLISATWNTNQNSRTTGESAELGYYDSRPVFCTKRCRAANEHRVERWASTKVRQERRKEADRG